MYLGGTNQISNMYLPSTVKQPHQRPVNQKANKQQQNIPLPQPPVAGGHCPGLVSTSEFSTFCPDLVVAPWSLRLSLRV